MTSLILGTVLPWCMIGVAGWFMHGVVRRQVAILARLDSLDRSLGLLGMAGQRQRMKENLQRFALEHGKNQPAPKPVAGLTPGTRAPEFDLPDLSGVQRKLEDFRGRKLLLVFFNPGCGFCVQMMPQFAELPVDGADGKPLPVAIVSGNAEAMRELAAEHLLRCPVLLDARNEIGLRYQFSGTPSGCIIDEHGVVASPHATGADALLILAAGESSASTTDGKPKTKGKVGRGLETSKINRAGLKAGTTAPLFRLPKMGGGELALEDLRGRRVLLVLSDPECGPCNAVASPLEELHRRTPDIHFVIISRRDEQTNRKKIAELGLTLPVVLQKSWEISKLYGIFETPVGYLIDENGVIVHDVARGADAILGLLSKPPELVILPFARAA